MVVDQWFNRALMQCLARPDADAPVPQHRPWTERKHHLLHMIAPGWANTRIARELNLGEQTVRNYISRLYVAIGVASIGSRRVGAAAWLRLVF